MNDLCSLMTMYTWKRSSKVNYFTLGTKIPFQTNETMSRLGFLSKNMTKKYILPKFVQAGNARQSHQVVFYIFLHLYMYITMVLEEEAGSGEMD